MTGLRDPIGVEAIAREAYAVRVRLRSAAARHPDVVELDLEQVARPAVHGLEPQPDRLPREPIHRDRGRPPHAVDVGVPPGDPEDLDLLPSDRSTIARSVSADDDVALWAKT